MRQLEEFLAVARAEMRAARRLVRTWFFVGLAVLLGGLSYVVYAGIHGVFSGFSSTVGAFSPRVLVSSIGMVMVMILTIGIVFLAFDIRARDQRERMAEVLDARPIGNLGLVAGRLAGLVFILWLVVLVVMMLMQLIGVTAKAFDWWVGDTLEPMSMVSFLVWDAIPALALWGALVVLLAVLVRNRFVVVIAALALLRDPVLPDAGRWRIAGIPGDGVRRAARTGDGRSGRAAPRHAEPRRGVSRSGGRAAPAS